MSFYKEGVTLTYIYTHIHIYEGVSYSKAAAGPFSHNSLRYSDTAYLIKKNNNAALLRILAVKYKTLEPHCRDDVRHCKPKFPDAASRYPGQANEGGSGRNRQLGWRVFRRPSHRDIAAQDGERGAEEEVLFARSPAESSEGSSHLPRTCQQCQPPAACRSEWLETCAVILFLNAATPESASIDLYCIV